MSSKPSDHPVLKTGSEPLRYEDVPPMESSQDVAEYLDALATMPHDYNTSGMAQAYAALAAFKFIAHTLGTTGFQAGFACLELVGVLMMIERPYGILKGEDMLYPQYPSLQQKATEWEKEWLPHIAKKAKEKLVEHRDSHVHPNVRAHWERLAKLVTEGEN